MSPFTIQQAFDLAVQNHSAGRLDEAERLYGQILARQPDHANATHNLGVIALQVGRNDDAVDLIRRAIALKPNFPEAHSNLGNALKDKGELDEAIAAYRQAIVLRPNYPEAHNNLGNALKEKGQLDEAIVACRQAIAFNPNYAEAYNNLGNALKDLGRLDEAIVAYRRAIAFKRDLPEAHNNLGAALIDNDQLDEAIVAYRQAIALRPNYADAHSNLGAALKDKGQLDGAIGAYRKAIAIAPDLAVIHYNLSLTLLMHGDFQQGWHEYEWRWKWKDFTTPPRTFLEALWDGCALEGRTILLHAEQGFGDSIQFIRYVSMVEQRGGRIIIECLADLQRLFRTVGRSCHIVVRGQPLPAFEFHSPLLSLPRIFGTTLDNLPGDIPYLHADDEEANKWRQRMTEHSQFLKVGLVWAGNPAHKNDVSRSMTLASLMPLARLAGVRFFSLQKGPASAQTKMLSEEMRIIDWTDELKDFADTAALIDNLDLVIGVDTAVVHLAGAMGKPVWSLLPTIADWRWLLEREDSPWYPSMRLFRKQSRGDWDSVITRVADALSGEIERAKGFEHGVIHE